MEHVRLDIDLHPAAFFAILGSIIMIVFMIGFTIGIRSETSRVKIEEPEVYAHFLQELESIPEIESFDVERDRYSGSYTYWSLSIRMYDDASFYFRELESIGDINTSIDKVRQYTECMEN